jgi:hypothetical protein
VTAFLAYHSLKEWTLELRRPLRDPHRTLDQQLGAIRFCLIIKSGSDPQLPKLSAHEALLEMLEQGSRGRHHTSNHGSAVVFVTGAKESKSPEGQLKRVLTMLAEFSGNRALCSYVVDALWDSTKVLQVSP